MLAKMWRKWITHTTGRDIKWYSHSAKVWEFLKN